MNKYVKYHAEAVKPYADVKSEFDAAAEAVKKSIADVEQVIKGLINER